MTKWFTFLFCALVILTACDVKARVDPINISGSGAASVKELTVSLTSTDPDITNTNIEVIALFNQEIENFTASAITVQNGTANSLSQGIIQGKSWVYSFLVQPSSDGPVSIQILAGKVTASTGSTNEASNQLEFTYDSSIPGLRDLSFVGGSLSNNPVPEVQFKLDKTATISLYRGSCTSENLISQSLEFDGDPGIQNISVLAPGLEEDGSHPIMIQAKTPTKTGTCLGVGNYVLDTTPPTVTLSSSAPQIVNQAFVIRATFSQAITGFDSTDIFIENENAQVTSGPTVVGGTNSTQWDFTIAPSVQGEIKIKVGPGAVEDLAGNSSTESDFLIREHDSIAPLVSFSVLPFYVNSSFSLDINFSEPVSDFEGADLAIEGGSLSDFQIVDSQNYQITVAPSIQGEVKVTVPLGSARDSALNANIENFTATIHDTQSPSVTLSSLANAQVNAPFGVNAQFDEPVTGLEVADFSITGGIISNVMPTSAATPYGYAEWSFDVTPQVEGTVRISLLAGKVEDRVGNLNSASDSLERIYDATAPQLNSITSTAPALVNAPFDVVLTFNEVMGSVESSHLSLVGATAGTPQKSGSEDGTEWTVTITPNSQGNVTVGIQSGGASDLAGNGVIASALQITKAYDNIQPSVVLSSVASEYVKEAFVVTGVWDESVDELQIGDLQATNASLSEFAIAPGTQNRNFSFKVTPFSEGLVQVSVSAGVVSDPTGNTNSASLVLERVYDITSPSATLSSATASAVNGPFMVLATFNEPVPSFSLSGIEVSNGTLQDLSQLSDTEWEFTVNPASGVVSVNVKASGAFDRAGNGSIISDVLQRTYDTTAPVLSSLIVTSGASPTTETSVEVSVTVDELASLELHDGSSCNSSLSVATSNVTGTQVITSYTLSDGVYALYVKAQDPAGNSVCELVRASHQVDTLAPESSGGGDMVTVVNPPFTNSDDINLIFDAVDATAIQFQVSLNQSASPTCNGTWEAYSVSKVVAIPNELKNSSFHMDVQFQDAVFNKTTCIRNSITHDNTVTAQPTVVINGDAYSTEESTVSVQVTASDSPFAVAISSDSSFCSDPDFVASWQVFSSSPMAIDFEVPLALQNSTFTLYARTRDEAGNRSPCGSDEILHGNTTPLNPSVAIENNAERTNENSVTLTLTASANGSKNMEAYITNNPDCISGGSWVDFTAPADNTVDHTETVSFSLSNLNQESFVYVKFRDKSDPNFQAECVSDSILHDNIPPYMESPAFQINGGAAVTTNTTLGLTLIFQSPNLDNPDHEYHYILYNAENCTGATGEYGVWRSYSNWASDSDYSLSPAEENTELSFSIKLRDRALNETECFSATILHDDKQPGISALVNPAGSLAGGENITLHGENFRPGSSDSVYFGTQKATCTLGALNPEGVASQLTCTVPAPASVISAASTVTLRVTNPSGLYADFTYTYQEAPVITGATTERSTSTGLTRTSEKVTLSGSYFRSTPSQSPALPALSISVDGEPSKKLTWESESSVSFTIPAFSEAGLKIITLTQYDGQSATFPFTVDERCSALLCGGAGGSCYDKSEAVDLSCATLEDGNEASSPLYLDYITRVPSVYINGGGTGEVTLTLSASYLKATEMYITNTAGCSTGGSWEPYALSKKWDTSGTVYAKFKDVSGNETACVNSSTGHTFRVWVEREGQKILTASGLWSDGWQYKLNPSGKGHNDTAGNEYLATQANLEKLEDRTNPANVYLDDANKFLTGRWVFYSQESETELSLSEGVGIEGVDSLTLWNGANTTNATDTAWYEGNISECSALGMRLPTLFEVSIPNPNTLDPLRLPLADGTATFSGSGNQGIPRDPSNASPFWTATSDPSAPEFDKYWFWRVLKGNQIVDSSKYDEGFRYVRCVLP